jgi:hypothetical protein
MSLFEYLSVATSIVLSLSAAQLLTRIGVTLQPDRRYWVHSLWVLVLLLLHLLIWWEFWAYRSVEAWNLAGFTLLLLNPGITLVCTSTLVNTTGAEPSTWGNHFYSVRRSFFIGLGLLPLVSVVRRWVLVDSPLLDVGNSTEAVFLLLCIIGWFYDNRRLHGLIAVTALLVLFLASGSLWFLPGQAAH